MRRYRHYTFRISRSKNLLHNRVDLSSNSKKTGKISNTRKGISTASFLDRGSNLRRLLNTNESCFFRFDLKFGGEFEQIFPREII